METKLTLSIDDEVIRRAKKYAKSQGRSLSDVVETYLKIITAQADTTKFEISDRVNDLMGSIKARKGPRKRIKS